MVNSSSGSESSSHESLTVVEQSLAKLSERLALPSSFSGFSVSPPKWTTSFAANREEADANSEQLESDSLPQIEAALAESPDRTDLKLLWFYCHVQRGEIPFAALVATHSELSTNSVLSDDKAELIYRASVLGFIRGLIERSQLRLAVEPLENLCGRATLEHEDRLECYQALEALYRAELHRAELRRETKSYIESLQQRISALPGKVREAEAQWRKHSLETTSSGAAETAYKSKEPSPTDRFARKSSALSSRSLLENLIEEDEKRDVPNESVSFFPKGPDVPVRRLILAVAGVLLLLLSWQVFSQIFGGAGFGVDSTVPQLAVSLGGDDDGDLTIALPEPGPAVTHDGGSPSIKELAKRLENMSIRKAPDSGTSSSDTVTVNDSEGTSKSEEEENAAIAARLGVVPTPPRTDKSEELPSESDDLLSLPSAQDDGHQAGLDSVDSLPTSVRQKLPLADSSKLSAAQVDDLGTAPPKNASPAPMLPPPSVEASGLVKGPDGRLYGPLPMHERATGLDGAPVVGVPVDQFVSPQRFRIINPTKVFSAPSIVASPLAELQQEAVIQVVARMGNWLEIQSSGGRRGFIHAQDAVPSQ